MPAMPRPKRRRPSSRLRRLSPFVARCAGSDGIAAICITYQKAGSKSNQLQDVTAIRKAIAEEFNVEIEAVINERFQSAVSDLRKLAAKATEELSSPVMRMLQIEECLSRHLKGFKAT